MFVAHGTGGGVALSVMQPRFAALLFVLGLADLAYVNLGLGHEVFGEAAVSPPSAGPARPEPARAPPAVEAVRAPNPPARAPAPSASPPQPDESPRPPEPSASQPSTPEPTAAPPRLPSAPALEPAAAAPSAPPSEALAVPSPAAAGKPAREALAPAELPSHDDGSRSAPAPATAAVPAGKDTPAPVASAAGLPDAELTVGFPDTASAGLTNEARAQLLALAAQLRENPDYRIQIIGHADERGSREFNRDLGNRRARAVTELLARAGVRREQLETESRGEDEPKALGASENVWAANRRVEISIGVKRSTAP